MWEWESCIAGICYRLDFSKGGSVKILVRGTKISRTNIPVTGLVGKVNGKNYCFSFAGKSYALLCIFRCYFLSDPAYYNSFRYWKLSQRQNVLLLWWSGTVATMLRPLKSEVREYISLRLNFCLNSPIFHFDFWLHVGVMQTRSDKTLKACAQSRVIVLA